MSNATTETPIVFQKPCKGEGCTERLFWNQNPATEPERDESLRSDYCWRCTPKQAA